MRFQWKVNTTDHLFDWKEHGIEANVLASIA